MACIMGREKKRNASVLELLEEMRKGIGRTNERVDDSETKVESRVVE